MKAAPETPQVLPDVAQASASPSSNPAHYFHDMDRRGIVRSEREFVCIDGSGFYNYIPYMRSVHSDIESKRTA
eukprot:2132560-Pyramimonas_sp.AAC.1